MSFKVRITLWFSGILIVFFLILFLFITVINNSVLQQNVKRTLIRTVNNNVSEVEYSLTAETPTDGEIYIGYGTGYIMIDRRFLKLESGVYSSLYSADGSLLYGENPVADINPDFSDGALTDVSLEGVKYYVFDRKVGDGLWLRGAISEQESRGLVWNATKLILLIFPLIALIAVVGGYRIASHFAAPITEISREADRIRTGDDLSKRLTVNRDDEIGKLAQSFNLMFERLENTFEREKRFNRDVSHELRTPLAVICAECEYALDRERTCDEYREILRTISEKSENLTSITQSLLTLAKIESNTSKTEMSPLDPADAVRAAVKETEPNARKNIRLTLRLDPNITVIGNEELLVRMFSNLISNAYKYGKENGHIDVSLTKNGQKAVICVSDDGVGIPPSEREKIFDRFYRAENSGGRSGTGIGLALVREISALHGASVKCSGNNAGGSTFTVTMDAI